METVDGWLGGENMKLGPYITLYININARWIDDLHVKGRISQLLEAV